MSSSARFFAGLLVLFVAAVDAGCAGAEPDAFAGVCLGEPLPQGMSCGELFNDQGAAACNLRGGCAWEDCDGSCGFCNGGLLGCRSRREAGACSGEPGCRWLASPECTSWEDCVVTWLDSGGCEEIATNTPSSIGYVERIDGERFQVTFADHCP